MRLYQKAKRLGTWDPQEIDLSVDAESWKLAPDDERDATLGTISVFQAGEESVTIDILPLIMAIAREGRLEEELYLTTFLFEEGKHVEFFNRWLTEVAGAQDTDLTAYHTPSYRRIFYEELPETMWALQNDASPAQQLRASITYNMIVEGMLAETGYYGFNYQLTTTGRTDAPGLLEGIAKLRQDESRHIAYGIYLISRILAEHPDLWGVAEQRMNELLPLAMASVNERLQFHVERWGVLPHGLDEGVIVQYAMGQYQKRMARLQRARSQSLAEIEQTALETEEATA